MKIWSFIQKELAVLYHDRGALVWLCVLPQAGILVGYAAIFLLVAVWRWRYE